MTHIFYAWLQLCGGHQTLLGKKQESQSDRSVKGEECVVQNPVIEVETRSIHYRRAPGSYTNAHRPNWINHISRG